MSTLKTEKPTAKKLRDLRREGQIALSREMSGLAAAVGFMAAVALLLPASWPDIVEHAREAFEQGLAGQLDLEAFVGRVIASIVRFLIATILAAGLASLVVTLFQTKFLISFSRIKLSFDRLNVVSNLKSMFSVVTLLNVIRQLSVSFAIMIGILVVERRLLHLQGAWQYCGLHCMPQFVVQICFALAAAGTFVILAAGYVDHLLQLKQFIRQNMMSKVDIRNEFKDTDGNPEIKGKRRQMSREISMGNPVQAAAKASVVVTNPTHVAVALHYNPAGECLPVITGMSDGIIALRMREAACAAGVPVMPRPPLARGLFEDGVIDDEIPSEYIDDVAEVFREVMNEALLDAGDDIDA